MSSKQISPLLRSWYKWKALRLPWRKRFLVGLDLQGNTYWEFRDERHGPADLARWRRIVQYPRTTHYGEVKVSPQWHQWLRHLREQPPSVHEQHAELRRQHQIKYLAAEADARWEAKPKVMEAPPGEASRQTTAPMLESRLAREEGRKDGSGDGPADGRIGHGEETRRNATISGEEQAQNVQEDSSRRKEAEKEDPWKKQSRAGPSEDWQPQAWAPPASRR
ncbi:unnamed protein product [Discula destructiva]